MCDLLALRGNTAKRGIDLYLAPGSTTMVSLTIEFERERRTMVGGHGAGRTYRRGVLSSSTGDIHSLVDFRIGDRGHSMLGLHTRVCLNGVDVYFKVVVGPIRTPLHNKYGVPGHKLRIFVGFLHFDLNNKFRTGKKTPWAAKPPEDPESKKRKFAQLAGLHGA